MHKQTAGISIIIPVYNSSGMLPGLIERLKPVLEEIGESYEVLLVNDGSNDESWTVITDLAACHEWIKGLELAHNYGQHNALLAGICDASHEIIVTIDADMEHPPEEIPKLLKKLSEGYDLVYGIDGNRTRGPRGVISSIAKSVIKKFVRINVPSNASSFRTFRRGNPNKFREYSKSFVLLDALIGIDAKRIASVPVRYDRRTEGESSYSLKKLAIMTLNILITYGRSPLRALAALYSPDTGKPPYAISKTVNIFASGEKLRKGNT